VPDEPALRVQVQGASPMSRVRVKPMLAAMNTKSNKLTHILVNNGGRRDSRWTPSNPYARRSRRGERQSVVLSPIERALIGGSLA
jgi:hypothetical protein